MRSSTLLPFVLAGTSVMQITARDADDHENTYNTATDPSAKTSAKTPRCLTPTCSPSTRTQESSLCSLLGWTNRSGVKRGYRVVQSNVHLSQLVRLGHKSEQTLTNQNKREPIGADTSQSEQVPSHSE